MAATAKKKFPGIFVVIAVSFMVYLMIVICVLVVHYKRPAEPNAVNKIHAKAP